jgi:hypothetical protein
MKHFYLVIFTMLATQVTFAVSMENLVSPLALDGRSCLVQIDSTVNTARFTMVTRPINQLGSFGTTRAEICHHTYDSDNQDQNIQFATDAQDRCLQAIALASKFNKNIDRTNCQFPVVD